MNNLFISYDLKNPGQDYDRVITAIKSLGSWAKVQYSLWYVSSAYTANQAAEIVRRAQDANDSLIVIDATNNDASWFNIDQKVGEFMQQHWNQRAAAASRY
ncbi:MAG: hypothetical protein KDA57_18150 [Planctomycetales bacterium]|nr:hypothetical protein [Planctomycetales bacterium]